MASKTLFRTTPGRSVPETDTVNAAGGTAYKMAPEAALAQYAATGCLNGTFYASAKDQLDKVLALAKGQDPKFIAQVAIWSREKGFMKDMPALLCAVLATRDLALFSTVFGRVLDTPKMIRNFVQIIRSGVVGRKSLGSRPKKLILKWLAARTPEGIFKGSVGNDPSLADILKMVHPKPDTDERRALYAYLIGKEYKAEALPKLVQEFEALKKSKEGDPPAVPFEMLTALELTEANWISIARNASWTQTRMNLNTFSRHGVFQSDEMTKLVADRLRDAEAIKKAKAFPYQLMVAFLNAAENVPKKVSEALQDAMEIAIENVPVIEGQVYVFPDVSGSMSSAITGNRPGSTSKVRCIDIAALIAAAILRKNPEAEVIPFEGDVHPIRLNPRDSVMTNATKLSRIGGGYTNCSAPLVLLNKKNAKADLLIYISDNESWVDSLYGQTHKGTETMKELRKIQNRSPKAKMVCIDIQAGDSTQAKEANDILNIGGFSDAVFDVVAKFATVGSDPTTWVDEIKKIEV